MAAQASAEDARLDGWVPSLDHATFVDWNHVYEPSEDTFLLLDALFADRAALRTSRVIVEIGPGSGVVATYLAKLTHNNVLAVDVNEAACALTTRTAAANDANSDLLRSIFDADALLRDLVDQRRDAARCPASVSSTCVHDLDQGASGTCSNQLQLIGKAHMGFTWMGAPFIRIYNFCKYLGDL